jgi:formate/nitrite transporter FocA (FNT family)
VVGLGAFPHVVAGSAEAIYVVFRGERTVADYVLGYLVPTLLGNAAGGVLLVGALAHAQHAPDQTG